MRETCPSCTGERVPDDPDALITYDHAPRCSLLLRDKREALYVRLLEYEREVMYGEEDDLIREALDDLVAEGSGEPLPSPLPTPDADPEEAEMRSLVRTAVTASLEHRELMAEVEVYASIEVAKLFTEFYRAQTDELVATVDAFVPPKDDDSDAARRREAAQQAQAQANFELGQQVRREVADG